MAIRRTLLNSLAPTYRLLALSHKSLRHAEYFLQGLVLGALNDEEKQSLTQACYQKNPKPGPAGLFSWEEGWFERELPKNGGHILLGGAGLGRELQWLQERGHRVRAFDPVLPKAPKVSQILRASYEDLCAAKPSPDVKTLLHAAPYDAVILGWGSFSHLTNIQTRIELLCRLKTLCDGPVLLSYWTRQHSDVPRKTRAEKLGRRIGAKLQTHAAAPGNPGEQIVPHCGYIQRFSDSDIESLACESHYNVTLHRGPYGFATLRPK